MTAVLNLIIPSVLQSIKIYIYMCLIVSFDAKVTFPKLLSIILSWFSGLGFYLLLLNAPFLNLSQNSLLIISVTSFIYPLIIYTIMFKKITAVSFVFSQIYLISANFFSGLLKTLTSYLNVQENRTPFSLISLTIEIIAILGIVFILKRKNNSYVIRDSLLKVSANLYAILIISSWILTFYTNIIFNDYYIWKKISSYAVIALTIMIIVFVLKLAIQSKENEETKILLEKQIQNQVEYYEKINSIYSEFRSFRHDFKNHILCLRYILEDNDIPKAQKYLDDMFEMSAVSRNKYNTGNIIIDSLLSDKNEKAVSCNSVINFEGTVPSQGISSADLCTIFANAIDNAIEACAKSEDNNQKEIKINSSVRQGYYFLNISNPVFDLVNIQNNTVTTSKKDKEHHGFGVSNITKTSRKYNGDTKIKVEDNQFILDVEILLDETITNK